MKVLILSKEFKDGEEISEYCKTLAEHLVNEENEVTIISFDDGSYYSIDDRVNVHRAPVHFEGDNIYNWSMILNNEIKREASKIGIEDYDIIHANEWMTVPGGVTLSKHYEKPLVLTIHSTENQRGFQADYSEVISELEWQGAYEADKILTTNEDTKNSVLFDLEAPEEKTELVHPYNNSWTQKVLNNYRELIKQIKQAKNQ